MCLWAVSYPGLESRSYSIRGNPGLIQRRLHVIYTVLPIAAFLAAEPIGKYFREFSRILELTT